MYLFFSKSQVFFSTIHLSPQIRKRIIINYAPLVVMPSRRKPSNFYSVFLSGNVNKSSIRIPNRFIRGHRKKILLHDVVLVVSDHKVWRLGWMISGDGKLWLHKGWPEFACHYRIRYGCLLLFKHLGKSVFHVTIFDSSNCEINYASPSKPPKLKKEIDQYSCTNVVTFAISKSEIADLGLKCNIFSENRLYVRNIADVSRVSSLGNPGFSGQIMAGVDKDDKCPNKPVIREETNDDDLSENVHYSMTKAIKKSHIYKMPMKKSFGKAVGINGYHRLRLKNDDGKMWKVEVRKYAKEKILYVGWFHFRKDNKLKIGDLCEFNHVKDNLIHVRVLKKYDTNQRVLSPEHHHHQSPSPPSAVAMPPSRRKPTNFYSVILSVNVNKNTLRIPKRFIRGHRKKILLNDVVVIVSDDKVWNFGWMISGDGKLWFQKGWPEFAHHYRIRYGHLLVFKHLGKSVFHVTIFDSTNCEIDYPPPPSKKPKLNKEIYQVDDIDQYDEIEVDNLGLEKGEEQSSAKSFKSEYPSYKIVIRPSYTRNWGLPSGLAHGAAPIPAVTPPRCTGMGPVWGVSGSGKADVALRWQPIQVVWVIVPLDFMRRYLTCDKDHVTCVLEMSNGRKWGPIECRNYKTFGKLYGDNLKKFYDDNHVGVGNVCVFQLIDEIEKVLKVTISRAERNNSRNRV
ncbi:hypothetical protein OSB04_000384 [Centaurea solstitialis]|uniref:TF-B3 domain-containing protein n=1 Tax=Centaurea solstitialis TaxID=347529 RepID=A0AA38TNY9_9ASTR|nr:hypothetical protein OSB04_000384 [Centaurea solstitialis]